MRIIVNRAALVEVLNAASAVAASRTTKDVLKCVRLTTVGDELLVSATDLEVAIRGVVAAVEVKKPGDMLIPAEKLSSIARESADETLTIEGDAQACHIRGTDSHFEVYGQDPREFPPVPDLEGSPDVEIEAEAVKGLIERTIFAVAKENTRYAINGVLWEKKAKKLAFVSTDGRRLARAVASAESSAGEDGKMIVPAKTVQVIQKILPGIDGNVGIRFSANQVIARVGGYVVSSALVEGHFPQYEEVIPKDCDRKIELNTEEFLSAVRRAALLTNDQSKSVRLTFDKERLVLSSRAPEQGEATVSMRIDYKDAPLDIGFNPAYLIEALRVVGTPTVTMELKEPNRPGLMRAGPAFLYVIMPVSLP
ncbi:MAG: DNA polymerase III subunit beta [Phycisphaerae bacterium]|jgi:DNA polymerase-3 subunit beta